MSKISISCTPDPGEECTPLTTGIDAGSWNIAGASATYTFPDGTQIVMTEAGTSWSTIAINNWGAWSQPIDGTTGLFATFSSNDNFTFQVLDAANQPLSPDWIDFHFDRVGGSSGSGLHTLQGGLTWSLQTGNTGFTVTPTVVSTSLSGTNQSGGTIRIDQNTDSFNVRNLGPVDALAFQITICV